LSARIRAVLDPRQRRGPAGRWRLAVASVVATLFLVISSLQIGAAVQAPSLPKWQKAAGNAMAFDVASVRPSEDRDLGNFPLNAESKYQPTGGLFRASLSLQVYIEFAYRLTHEQAGDWLSHLPKWVESQNYAIQARTSNTNASKDQMRLMMQSLLAERFKLKVHFDNREVPIYALTLINVEKLGPEIHLHSEGPPCPQSDDNPFGSDATVFPHQCGFSTAPAGLPNKNPQTKRASEHNIGLWGRDVEMERVAIHLLGY